VPTGSRSRQSQTLPQRLGRDFRSTSREIHLAGLSPMVRSAGLRFIPISRLASGTVKRCIIYIMRRTQLYLDDHLWNALHARARSRKTSISELVREAVRDRYLGKRDEQAKAMQEFVGIRKDRAESIDAVEYVRSLRRSDRFERLSEE